MVEVIDAMFERKASFSIKISLKLFLKENI